MKKILSPALLIIIVSIASVCKSQPDEEGMMNAQHGDLADDPPEDPVIIVDKIINKMIKESSFELMLYEHASGSSLQVLDFKKHSGNSCSSIFYAYTNIIADHNGEAIFGISAGSPVKIWINNKLVYSTKTTSYPWFKEIAYGIFEFPEYFRVFLNKGNNSILVKSQYTNNLKTYFCAVKENGYENPEIVYSVESVIPGSTQEWIFTGPFPSDTTGDYLDKKFLPEENFKPYYFFNGQYLTWQIIRKDPLVRVRIPDHASFQNHPYTEWNYSNGVTMWSILKYAEFTGNNSFHDFVSKFCRFTLETLPYFRYQYYDLNETDGFNHRIFRMHMLDDASAPALPFLELFLRGEIGEAEELLKKVEDYLMNGQYRLQDGTLCRPEPERFTIWADDLFMSVPFLMKYGALTGKSQYTDQAIIQIINFYHYLFDYERGLCYHGWLDRDQKNSISYWSRANGWMIWALAETLDMLPEDHNDFKTVLRLFQQHVDGLIKYQDETGLWHQVLDHPESFLETSSTAMFVLGIARGVNNGWLPAKYEEFALKGWEGILTQIEEDGTVNGICQGTEIGENLEFYLNRNTRKHDPRGIGAVITAGMEISKMKQLTKMD